MRHGDMIWALAGDTDKFGKHRRSNRALALKFGEEKALSCLTIKSLLQWKRKLLQKQRPYFEFMADSDFYVRYYVGHKGKFGHEFLEFEFRPDGKLRYANNSNYKNDTMIRKEVYVTQAVLDEVRRIIEDAEVRAANPRLHVRLCIPCLYWFYQIQGEIFRRTH